MLDGFIIEELRRREEAERNKSPRPVIELPLPERRDESVPAEHDADGETVTLPRNRRPADSVITSYSIHYTKLYDATR